MGAAQLKGKKNLILSIWGIPKEQVYCTVMNLFL